MDAKLQDRLAKLTEDPDPVAITKIVVRKVVRYSVKATVALTIQTYIPVEGKKQKLQLFIASWALCGWVAEEAGDWAADRVGNILELFSGAWDNVNPKPEDEFQSNVTFAE